LASVETRATANYIVGNSLLHQGRLDEAVERFQKVLALDPQSTSSRVGLGVACFKMGRVDEAIVLFQKVLEIDPNIAEAHYDLGCGLLQMGRTDEAFIHFQKAVAIEPDILETRDPAENNNLAWVLATSPEATYRNGAFAVKLAENACRRTHYQEKTMMGTLAAAYAETGRFDEAISTAQKACALASQSGKQELLEEYQYMLALYLKHQPFHYPK
jgi:tetratricopeptide (TPR) repeat protein